MQAQTQAKVRDGVRVAPLPEKYELTMRHHSGRDVRANSGRFDDLLELREQLMRLGYSMLRLSRIA